MTDSVFWNTKSKDSHGIPLIEFNGGQLTLAAGGGKLFDSQPEEQACNLCFIFGNARSGKSFMMNCLSGVKGLFKVIKDSKPCTKGVDINSRFMAHNELVEHVQTYSEVDMDNIKELGKELEGASDAPLCGFVDVEGQGAEDSMYDTLLALPLLLTGKVVLYNHKGAPTVSHMLSQLGVLARAAEYVDLGGDHDSDDDDDDDDDEKDRPKKFGHLHVLFRDFSFDGDEDSVYKQLMGKEKVPKSRGRQAGQLDVGKAAKERNIVRKLLLDNFQSITVHLFKQPASGKDLMEQNELPWDKIDTEFLDSVRSMLNTITHQMAEPTKFHGKYLTGPKYHQLLKEVCQIINEGETISVPSVFRAMEKETINQTKKQCLAMFTKEAKKIHDMLPLSEKKVDESLEELENRVFQKFDDGLEDCLMIEERKEARAEIGEQILKSKTNIKKDNVVKTIEFISKLYSDESSNVKSDFDKFYSNGQPFENPQDLDTKFNELKNIMLKNINVALKDLPGVLDRSDCRIIQIDTQRDLQQYFNLKSIQNENTLKDDQISKMQDNMIQQQQKMIEQNKKLEQFLDEEKSTTQEMEEQMERLRKEQTEQKERTAKSRKRIEEQQEELERLRNQRKICTIL